MKRMWEEKMETQHEQHGRSTILYDAGCGSVMVIVFGAVFLGVGAGYFPDDSITALVCSWSSRTNSINQRVIAGKIRG
jgi:hypothetical protein